MATWLIWFLSGLGLGVLEMVVPGFIIIFFGLGCMGAAVVAAIAPGAYALQVAVFIAVAVVSLIALRKMAMKMFTGKTDARGGVGDSSVEAGTVISVDQAIPPGGKGRVRYRGTLWDAKSVDGVQAGAEAEILGVDEMNRSCLVIRQMLPGVEAGKGEEQS